MARDVATWSGNRGGRGVRQRRAGALLIGVLVAVVLVAPPASSAAPGAGATITELEVPGLVPSAGPAGITAGPDGNQWITLDLLEQVGRLTPTGALTTFPLGTAGVPQPTGIVAGPDGRLWIAAPGSNAIVAMATDGSTTVFAPVATAPLAGPELITVGPDGALWFTERNANTIGRITTTGAITELPYATTLPQPAVNAGASGIAGAGGAIWITTVDQVERLDLQTQSFTSFPAPGALGSSSINHLTAGGDGNAWFTGTDHVFRVTPAGAVTAFPAPSGQQIVLGPDGALWYPANNPVSFVRVAADGSTTSFTDGLNTVIPDLGPLSAGPGSTLWFVHQLRAGVGRIDLDASAAAAADPSTTTTTTAAVPRPATAVAGTPSFTG